jgi:hypothetical protein
VKRLLYAVCGLFGFLLALSVYMAFRADDGLVEEGYSEKAARYFAVRGEEERLGLSIHVPERLHAGRTRLSAVIATSDGPLTGASVSLRAARVSGRDAVRNVRLPEKRPGIYAAEVLIPAPGRWFLSLAVESDRIRTDRTWIATADALGTDRPPSGGPPDRGEPGLDIHSGPVSRKAGSLIVTLDIAPKPVRSMRELLFTVSVPGYEGQPPRIDLAMPGMAMPPSRVTLAKGTDGLYRGTGVIVRCVSGRRTWTAAVTVPGHPPAAFPFDVAD